MGRKSDDKKSFQLYNDYIEHFSLMSDEDAGKLIKAIFSYVNEQPFEELEGLPLMAFSFIRSQLQRDRDKYDARCEVNRRNGSLGGRPKKQDESEKTDCKEEKAKKPNGYDENQTVLQFEEKTEKDTPAQIEEKPPKPEKAGYTTEFETFWKNYPRKAGKGEAYKKYKARLNDGWSPDELMEAAENYRKKCDSERTEEKYIKHAKTFLSDTTPFVDYLNKGKTQEPKATDDGINPFR